MISSLDEYDVVSTYTNMGKVFVVNYDMCLAGDVAYVVVFFFQAEDGIRDYKVTGVQTCALPISRHRDSVRGADLDRARLPVDGSDPRLDGEPDQRADANPDPGPQRDADRLPQDRKSVV